MDIYSSSNLAAFDFPTMAHGKLIFSISQYSEL